MAKRTKTVSELTEEQLEKRRLIKKLSARKSRAKKRAAQEALKAEADLEAACHKKVEQLYKVHAIEKEAEKDHIERLQQENPAFPFLGDMIRCRVANETLQPDMHNILVLVLLIFQIQISKQAMHHTRLWSKTLADGIRMEIESEEWDPSVWWNLGRKNAIK